MVTWLVVPESFITACTWNPHMGPKAAVTHATYPLFSGKAVASSAVIKASGTDQISGNAMKPMIQSRGPAALTASYMAAGDINVISKLGMHINWQYPIAPRVDTGIHIMHPGSPQFQKVRH